MSFSLIASAQQWTSVTPLPDGYQEHILVYANGFLYNIGGVSESNAEVDGTNVFYSQVYTNGTIGPWGHTTPLPEAVFDSVGVVAAGFVYVLAGEHWNATGHYDYTSDAVYYAKINSDGTLGAWQTANPLPYEVYWHSAAASNNRIYVVGGVADGPEVNSVYSANIQRDGSLSTWVAQSSFPYPVYAQSSVANGILYVLAGAINQGANITSNVYCSKINGDGTLTGWTQTTSLPQALSNFAAVAANGYIFTIDGFSDSGDSDDFYEAAVAGDGSLRSWLTGTPLPQALIYHSATVSGSYIFVSGGNNTSYATAAVYSMPLPPPPATPTLKALAANQTMQLQLTSSTNTGFGIMASTNLNCWCKIGWGFTDSNGLFTFLDTNTAGFSYRLYRTYWPLP